MILKYRILGCIAVISSVLCACGPENRNSEKGTDSVDLFCTEYANSEADTHKALIPTGDPEKDWIFAEQAVDAWLYFNLSDFKSYEPLIRSNDYDSVRDVFTHHLRFRYMNEQGGMVTVDKDFEVDLNHKGENGNPFYVKEIR